ncbi:MAG: hypothetical protein ABI843_11165 [Dokdonella sp.]
MRRALFVLALAASWWVLLLWAADVDWRAPIMPTTQRAFSGSEFAPVFGKGVARSGNLHLDSAAEDFSSLQSVGLPNLEARDFTTLRYRFADFPRTLELSLVFRTAQAPDDVQTISLPWPGDGESSFDLSHVDKWRGAIIELGFAEFATGQVVPPELGFRPFDLVGAQLWSPSWRGDLGALMTDWLGAWPWSQRSVHALGREGNSPRAHSEVLVAALAAAFAIVWAAMLLGLRGQRLLTTALVFAALAWIALDLRWQAGLVQRLLATRTLYAGLEWPQRARIVGDSDILQAADEVRQILHDEPANTRILVDAGSGYEWLRLVWHLIPLNVAGYPLARMLGAALPENCLLVFYDNDAWRSNPDLRKLLASSQRVTSAASLHVSGFEGSRVVVFRFHHAH